ncbi:hypothetical protein FISHEDRAFT_47811 [Fistulina hepatica ATCC 64428]|uniref:Microbial-type PARG catalytic domain-containing protein n=1 Tax=Fistulina hepatica ATCC 64428 TaxID=1128425 RepID=A0A0D7A5L7_9AGAR|nr:hypothetical protein FISHEDRAFT_47811 [Fistulina hepatica ATCC 64428]
MSQRSHFKRIAEETLAAIERRSYEANGVKHSLKVQLEQSIRRTRYYAPDSLLCSWRSPLSRKDGVPACSLSVCEMSTLEGVRLLDSQMLEPVGVLNFASAKKPGGGFLTGALAQEESIARSSTLYPTLMIPQSQQYYMLHHKDPKGGYYSHAMIYSPNVVVCRTDDGMWSPPIEIAVVTSPAVNAGGVRSRQGGSTPALESGIASVMRERMGRVLYLFEQQGRKHLVLGSFGTGVFQNDVGTVAGLWADLLMGPNARFSNSFSTVLFAILGHASVAKFNEVFDARKAELESPMHELPVA